MDVFPLRPFPPQLRQQEQEEEETQEPWWKPDSSFASESSIDTFLPDSVAWWQSVDDKHRLPKAFSRLASIGGLSSCTELSEEELRLAEVNPVTFEVLAWQRHRQKPDMAAYAQEHSIDLSSSSTFGNRVQATSRLQGDADLISDGEFSHPAVSLSECHYARPPSPGTSSLHRSSHQSEETIRARVKLLCSFDGRIMPRPVDGKLRYAGGETRIVIVNGGIGYNELLFKMSEFYGVPLGLKYQFPDEDLDSLISVSSDDDFQNMMEEHERLELGGGVSRLRLFFFTSPADLRIETGDRGTNSDQLYVEAINGVTGTLNDATGLRQVEDLDVVVPHNFDDSGSDAFSSAAVAWSGSSGKAFPRAPSAPSSSPSSPPLASRQERLNLGSTINPWDFEGNSQEMDQNGSGSPLSPSHCDHQFHIPPESPKRTHLAFPVSGGESWRNADARMHHVDSQTKLISQSEQYMDGSTSGAWHDVQQPAEVLLPQVELQRLLQQHKQIPEQQPLPVQLESNLARGETVHQLHQPVQHPHPGGHLRLHQIRAGHDAWHSDHQAITPFLQGSVQANPQNLHGLAAVPPYKMGSAPSSPRVAVQDYQGRCSCAQQHSPVHHGINVSLGDQTYTKRPSHFGDQPIRKHGLPNSSRFCDNPSHCGESFVMQQQPSLYTGQEAEFQEQNGNIWQHVHERHTAPCYLAECRAMNHPSHYCDTPLFVEGSLPPQGRHEANRGRCACMGCNDHRREHLEKAVGHPVYADLHDQVGDTAMQQRSLALDDGRISAAGRAFGNIEDWRGEFEVEKLRGEFAGDELQFYSSHAKGEFELKGGLSMPIGGQLHIDEFPGHRMPISRPLISENSQAYPALSSTLVHGRFERPLNMAASKPSVAAADSWSIPSLLEPRVWSDPLPSLNAQAPHRLMEEKIGTSLGQALPATNCKSDSVFIMDGTTNLKENSLCDRNFTWKHDQEHGGAVCITAGDLLLPSYNHPEAMSDSIRSLAANRQLYLTNHDVILTDSVAPSQAVSTASHTWQSVRPGVLNLTTLESSSNTLAFPVYDQSPLSSTNTAEFSFEPNEANFTPGQADGDKDASTSRMSVMRLLADGMISSILKSCSNEGPCEESEVGDHEVVVSTNPYELTEEGTKDLLGGTDLCLPPPSAQGRGCPVIGDDDWHRVGVDAQQMAGVIPVVQNGATNEIAYEEKDAEECAESEGLAVTHAEAEARARGLQIIKNADLEDLRELGSGTFGTVFHGKWRGSDVAIKRIKASCFTGGPSEQERMISDFWKEACTLGQLHHPNVVAFYGVVPDGPGGTLGTVTEYMVNGSLKQVLQKKDRTIDRKKRLLIAMDAAFGMEYLHSKSIVHFDLKCENLLVNMRDAHRPICKVGDFGLSKVKHQTLVSGGVRGTLPWMAPELLSGNSSMVTEKIDVFSFGIVMWELLTGEEPYANMHCGAIIGGIVNNTLRPPIPSWCDPSWRTLMERCWSADPADRPAFWEVARELRGIAASMNVK